MTKKIKRLDETPVDVFEAVKRARMKHGYIRGRGVRSAQPKAKPAPRAADDDKDTKTATLKADEVAILMPVEDPEKLLNLTENSQENLAQASTVFPMTLVPDTISIDREKITIAKRTFFRVASVNSIPITDIQSVEVDVGPFFGTLRTTSKYFVNNQREVRYLWRDDATKIHHLLQGLILAHQRQVDINTLDREQLLVLLNDLGQGVSD